MRGLYVDPPAGAERRRKAYDSIGLIPLVTAAAPPSSRPLLGPLGSAGSLAFSPTNETPVATQQRTPISDQHDGHNNLENAVLESMHTSTTESVLQWHHFDAFPTLGRDYVPIFQLEQCRTPIRTGHTSVYLYTKPEDVEEILLSFEQTVNFWYPTMSRTQIHNARMIMTTVPTATLEDDSVHICLALLTMALGCAIARLSPG